MKKLKYLITGGCGFLGSNIALQVLKKGYELIIFDNLSRFGSYKNLEWLNENGKFIFIHGDIRNSNDVENVIRKYKPDIIYHLAGQVAMTTSILDPKMDFEVNTIGSFNLLNSVRLHSRDSIIVYSSTNKVYGDLEYFSYKEEPTRYLCLDMPYGFDEDLKLDFASPYGNSKGSADQYMLDFANIYDLKTVVFRHSSMFGGRQFPTFDQGWINWFIYKAIELKEKILKEPFTISGNGKQVRDLLYSDDIVLLYLSVFDNIDVLRGKVFNIGGGIKNSISILELFSLLEEELDIKMSYIKQEFRESDQKVFIADITKIKNLIGWEPKIDKYEGVRGMIAWFYENKRYINL